MGAAKNRVMPENAKTSPAVLSGGGNYPLTSPGPGSSGLVHVVKRTVSDGERQLEEGEGSFGFEVVGRIREGRPMPEPDLPRAPGGGIVPRPNARELFKKTRAVVSQPMLT